MVNGSELSVSAYVMDHEGNLLSDAMLTINDEPMNISFFATEDMGMDTAEKGVQCGDYQPSYFLNPLNVNEGDTVDFVAKGRQCITLYTSSVVVPEKITIIEPSGDEPVHAGEPVVVRWEGGAPCSQFRVMYYRGSDDEMFSSGIIHGSTEFTMPAHWVDEGWGVIFVDGCFSGDEDDQKEKESGLAIRVEADLYVETVDASMSVREMQEVANALDSCQAQCNDVFRAQIARCRRILWSPTECENLYAARWRACNQGCSFCPR